MSREIVDVAKRVTITLPNAANQVNSSGIDLEQATPFPLTEQIQARIAWTTATGANNLNLNFVLQDSADNVTFANIAQTANPAKVLASLNTVYAAGSVTVAFPVATQRYIRVFAKGEANGGNAGDGTATLTLLF